MGCQKGDVVGMSEKVNKRTSLNGLFWVLMGRFVGHFKLLFGISIAMLEIPVLTKLLRAE